MSVEQETAETRTSEHCGRRAARTLSVGEKVARFEVVRELGAGGMGRVYEAYDPELDRRVALKQLREPGVEGSAERLLLEAQALARLDHPNVVGVHDVGVHDGVLFVAMDFIAGGTLKDWAVANPVGSSGRFEAALRLLVDAGRGVVAAHKAGLVHRDIKPSNILVGEDGRARVADFGIARALVAVENHGVGSLTQPAEGFGSAGGLAPPVTRTGVLAGTPAYMAPEQLAGGAVGVATDQFAFCVTAWELLYGVRPFSGADLRHRLASIRKGEVRRAHPGDADVEIEPLLGRGLRFRASARHAQLEDLIDALSRRLAGRPAEPPRFGRRLGGAALAAALVAVGVYASGTASQHCTGAAKAFEAVWGPTQREEARLAMLSTGTDFAASAWERFEAGVDDYGRQWRAAHTESCDATRVRGEQSPQRMEEQMACLEDAKRSVGAAVSLVSSGETSAIVNELALIEGLPSISACGQRRGVPSSAELGMLEAVASAGAQRRAGQVRLALELIEPVAEQLEQDTSPTVATRVLLEYGRGLSEVSGRRAIGVLREAHSIARTEGLGELSAATAREITRQLIGLLSAPETIRPWLDSAKSAAGDTSAEKQNELQVLEAALLEIEGDRASARALLQSSVDAAENDPKQLPRALRALAEHLQDDDTERAVRVAGQALELYLARYGTSHPGAASFEDTLAGALGKAGDLERAKTLARRATERVVTVWGKEHTATSPYLVRQAELQCADGPSREGAEIAKTAVALHRGAEASRTRYRALLALVRCTRFLERLPVQHTASELVQVAQELYGRDHFLTLHARAMYASALLATSEAEKAEKQVALGTSLGRDKGPGWSFTAALELHSVLAAAASRVELEDFAVHHAEALFELERGATGDGVALNAERCAAYRLVGEEEEALASCLEAVAGAGGPMRLVVAEYETGRLMRELGRTDEALLHTGRALQNVDRAFGADSYYRALIELELGALRGASGELRLAEDHYRASQRVLAKVTGPPRLQLLAGLGAAIMASRGGRPREALDELEDLRELAVRSGGHSPADLSRVRGLVLHELNPHDGAREYAGALHYYRFAGDERLVAELCEQSPFELRECDDRGDR